MRVYHFLKSSHAESNILSSHLKVSIIDRLNDPFEFAPFDKLHEEQLKEKAKISKIYGLLCFSRSYSDPAMWAHYGDNHKGICLGFDVPSVYLLPVNYSAQRLHFPLGDYLSEQEWQSKIVVPMVSTKSISWEHEQEVRMPVMLNDCEKVNDTYFYPFNINVRLEEVIFGCRNIGNFENSSVQIRQPIQISHASLSESEFKIDKRPITNLPSKDA